MHDLNTNAEMAIKWHKITHSSCKHRVFICLPKNCVYALCMALLLYADLMIPCAYINLISFHFIYICGIVDEHYYMWHTLYLVLAYAKPTPQYTEKGHQNENDQFVNQVFKQQQQQQRQRQQIATLGRTQHPLTFGRIKKLINNKCLNCCF